MDDKTVQDILTEGDPLPEIEHLGEEETRLQRRLHDLAEGIDLDG